MRWLTLICLGVQEAEELAKELLRKVWAVSQGAHRLGARGPRASVPVRGGAQGLEEGQSQCEEEEKRAKLCSFHLNEHLERSLTDRAQATHLCPSSKGS